jgi:hypothetical protein
MRIFETLWNWIEHEIGWVVFEIELEHGDLD